MRISDWSSDVCSSDLRRQFLSEDVEIDALALAGGAVTAGPLERAAARLEQACAVAFEPQIGARELIDERGIEPAGRGRGNPEQVIAVAARRSDEIVEIGRAACRERVCQYV